jgi:hypothetical protein
MNSLNGSSSSPTYAGTMLLQSPSRNNWRSKVRTRATIDKEPTSRLLEQDAGRTIRAHSSVIVAELLQDATTAGRKQVTNRTHQRAHVALHIIGHMRKAVAGFLKLAGTLNEMCASDVRGTAKGSARWHAHNEVTGVINATSQALRVARGATTPTLLALPSISPPSRPRSPWPRSRHCSAFRGTPTMPANGVVLV